MGGANSRDPPLIHNCSADAMAHGSRWWRRCYGTRSQMVAQMERQKEKREREREREGGIRPVGFRPVGLGRRD